MAKVVAIVNQKGGVGKTATTCNVATNLAINHKLKILVIDIDPSRNLTKPLLTKDYQKSIVEVLQQDNFDPENAIYSCFSDNRRIENLYIMPSHVSLAMLSRHLAVRPHREKILERQIDKVSSNYDLILIDCPPMLSEFSIVSIYASDFFIIPIKYEDDALEGIQDLFVSIRQTKEVKNFNYKMLKNGHDGRKEFMIKYIDRELENFVKHDLVFKTKISQDEEINKAKANKQPILFYSPNSRAVQDYQNLSLELLEALNV